MSFDSREKPLARQLLDAGVDPKYISRLVRELSEHHTDLVDEARASGLEGPEARADAFARLGDREAIAAEFARRPELQSWVYSSKALRVALRASAWIYLTLRPAAWQPIAYPDGLLRYTAAGATAVAITGGLLLSMVLALTPQIGGVADDRGAPAKLTLTPPRRDALARVFGPPIIESVRGRGNRPSESRPETSHNIDERLRDRPLTPRAGTLGAPGSLGAFESPVSLPSMPAAPVPAPFTFSTHLPDPPRLAPRALAGDHELRAIASELPDYPRQALRLGVEGFVVVEYAVNRNGGVEDLAIVDSSHELFHRAALESVRGFAFSPRTVGGEPVEVRGVRTTVRFRFEN